MPTRYFPTSLPPPFQTASFASLVETSWDSLPANFKSSAKPARPTFHSLGRVGGLRRRLGIPNPVSQVALAAEIARHWRAISTHTSQSPFSKSMPVLKGQSGRAIGPEHEQSELTEIRAANRANAKFVLQADISRFYESIYTHSVPWAIPGKALAKKRRNDRSLLGNRLDLRLRTGNDHQTVGIPIGPDSSLVIAEVILASADVMLASRLPRLRGHRYVDDYEFCFSNRVAAEDALAALQDVLSDFELALNPRKTSIIEAPLELKPPWVHELAQFRIGNGKRGQANDLVAYFDRAFSLARELRQEHILKYGIARLRSVKLHPENWVLFQDLLFQAMATEPPAVEPVLEQLFKYVAKGMRLQRTSLRRGLSQLMTRQARLGHANEVAWAIWASIALGLRLSAASAEAISTLQDSVVALLALHARDSGLVPTGLNTKKWRTHMNTDSLYGEQWLLSYEANVKGWLRSQGRRDHVNADPNFSYLKRNGVHFYDVSRTVPMVPTGVAPSSGTAELFSLPTANEN